MADKESDPRFPDLTAIRERVAVGLIRRNMSALSAEIDGEVVALDVARGVCYGLDPIGARIWSLIESPSTLAALCETLTREYEVDEPTCRRDVLDLVTELLAEGLASVEPAAMQGA
jgi:hypothetical protein